MLEQQKAGAPARGKRKTTEELLQMVERDQENGASIVKQIRERRPGRPIQPPAHPPEDILNPLVPRAAHAQTGFAVSLTPASAGTNCGPASLPSDTIECRPCLYHESPLAFAGTYIDQIVRNGVRAGTDGDPPAKSETGGPVLPGDSPFFDD